MPDDATGGPGRHRDPLDTTFNVVLYLKGADGVLELIGGVFLLVVSPATLDAWVRRLTQHELSQDPHDFFATHLLHAATNLNKSQLFGAIYLLTHGVAKLIVVVGLLLRKHWAYYVAFAFLGAFLVYQIYRMTYAPSVGLALLTVFDLLVLWLTWREFLRMRAARRAPPGDEAPATPADRSLQP